MNKCIKALKETKRPVESLDGYYIYILWDDEEVVYVGQSINLESRVGAHRRNKDFNYYSFYECKSKLDMDLMESDLILRFEPKYNRSLGNGYISLNKLRERIRQISDELKYNSDFYVSKIARKLKKSDIEVIEFGGISSIKKKDEVKAVRYLLEGYNE